MLDTHHTYNAGKDFLRRIRNSKPGKTIPVSPATSFAMSVDRIRLPLAGGNGSIENRKPIDPLIIIKQIKAIINE